MLASKKTCNQQQELSCRRIKIVQHYKNKLLNSTAPKKSKKIKACASKSNTGRMNKLNKIQSCIQWKNKANDVQICKNVKSSQKTKQQQQSQKQSMVVAFRQIETARQLRFLRASKKLFRGMDFFGKGVITQANINRWVPQSALYFLGTIFQRIKNSRIAINQQQFVIESEKIRQISNKEDVDLFVIDIENMKLHKFNRQIKKSSCFEEKTESCQIESKVQQTIRVSNFRKKQESDYFAPIDIQRQKKQNRQNQVKQQKRKRHQKKQIIKPLMQQEDVQRLKGALNSLNEMAFYERNQQKVLNQVNNRQTGKSYIKQSKNQKAYAKEQNFYFEKYKNTQTENQKNIYSERKNIYNENQKIQQRPMQIRQSHRSYSMQKQNATKYIEQNKYKQMVDQQLRKVRIHPKVLQNDVRIDNLSSKVEQFIKKNAERIQRSKNLRQQI